MPDPEYTRSQKYNREDVEQRMAADKWKEAGSWLGDASSVAMGAIGGALLGGPVGAAVGGVAAGAAVAARRAAEEENGVAGAVLGTAAQALNLGATAYGAGRLIAAGRGGGAGPAQAWNIAPAPAPGVAPAPVAPPPGGATGAGGAAIAVENLTATRAVNVQYTTPEQVIAGAPRPGNGPQAVNNSVNIGGAIERQQLATTRTVRYGGREYTRPTKPLPPAPVTTPAPVIPRPTETPRGSLSKVVHRQTGYTTEIKGDSVERTGTYERRVVGDEPVPIYKKRGQLRPHTYLPNGPAPRGYPAWTPFLSALELRRPYPPTSIQ